MKQFTHFNLGEFFAHCSDEEILTALHIKTVINNLIALDGILENFRAMIDSEIFINSAYRDAAHNKHAGGSPTSQHLNGEAADIACRDGLLPLLAKFLINCGLVQNDMKDDEMSIARIGQVIVYTDSRMKIRFIHVALANHKHPKFELWHDVRGTKYSDGLRKVVGDAIDNFIKLLNK